MTYEAPGFTQAYQDTREYQKGDTIQFEDINGTEEGVIQDIIPDPWGVVYYVSAYGASDYPVYPCEIIGKVQHGA